MVKLWFDLARDALQSVNYIERRLKSLTLTWYHRLAPQQFV